MYKKLRAVLIVVMLILFALPVTAYAQTNGEENAQESESAEETEEAAPNTFSEDGNATLGDSATSADDKEFITVTTREGNVFYLVIDHQREDNNVYFLNMVDASDLQAFVEKSGQSGLDSIVSLPEETEPEPETTKETTAESEDAKSGDVVTDGLAQAKSGGNLNYLIVIILAGVLGAAYYFKIHKKKQQSVYDEYETEEEYEEDNEYEQDDEQEEDEDEYEEDEAEDSGEQAEKEAREAERRAKLEAERQVKLEQERIRKEKIREKREQLEAQSKKLEEEQKRLHEEQQRLEDEQEKIQVEQEEANYEEEYFK